MGIGAGPKRGEHLLLAFLHRQDYDPCRIIGSLQLVRLVLGDRVGTGEAVGCCGDDVDPGPVERRAQPSPNQGVILDRTARMRVIPVLSGWST